MSGRAVRVRKVERRLALGEPENRMPGTSSSRNYEDKGGETNGVAFPEYTVQFDATLLDRTVRHLAEILAAGYLRLLADRDDHRYDGNRGHDPSISLDSRAQQSDELDRRQRPRRPRCKQI